MKIDVERHVAGSAVVVDPHAHQIAHLDVEAGLLAYLAASGVGRVLALLAEAAGYVPRAQPRLVRAADQQQTAALVGHERTPARLGVQVVRYPTSGTRDRRWTGQSGA